MNGAQRILEAAGQYGAGKAKKDAVRLRLGTVQSVSPLQVLYGGVVLDAASLFIDARLLPDAAREAQLGNVYGRLEAQVDCSAGAITSLQASSGALSGQLKWTAAAFAVGDTVLMLTDDDQRFFILSKVVSAT